MNKNLVLILGVGLIITALVIVYCIYALWPISITQNNGVNWVETSCIFGQQISISDEKRIIILVLLSGFLGSYVHVASSFTNFVGNKKFEISWTWWYLLRPFIGMCLGLIFYLVFRGGMFAGNSLAEDLNLYGILTLSALSGLFSDRATLKLEEIYDSLFKPNDNREDKLKGTGD